MVSTVNISVFLCMPDGEVSLAEDERALGSSRENGGQLSSCPETPRSHRVPHVQELRSDDQQRAPAHVSRRLPGDARPGIAGALLKAFLDA